MSRVYKAGLDDPSELVKKRKKAALRDNANQISEKTFFQPVIPGELNLDFNVTTLLQKSNIYTHSAACRCFYKF